MSGNLKYNKQDVGMTDTEMIFEILKLQSERIDYLGIEIDKLKGEWNDEEQTSYVVETSLKESEE